LTLPVGAEPVPPFDCSCMNAIEPVGTVKEAPPSIHDSFESAVYLRYTTMGGFTLNADNTLCQATVEVAIKKFKEDPYVFLENRIFDGPVCYYWALCNGRTNNDQAGCPYQTP
jgi:hypothetical protein